jgi:hypothetical protein
MSMSWGELEYHIPVPPKKVEQPVTVARRFRFADMTPGSSKFFPAEDPIVRNRLAISAHSYARTQTPKWEMRTRKKMKNGVVGLRVWRVK